MLVPSQKEPDYIELDRPTPPAAEPRSIRLLGPRGRWPQWAAELVEAIRDAGWRVEMQAADEGQQWWRHRSPVGRLDAFALGRGSDAWTAVAAAPGPSPGLPRVCPRVGFVPDPHGGLRDAELTFRVRVGAEFTPPAEWLSDDFARGRRVFEVAVERSAASGGWEVVESAVCGMDLLSLHRSRVAAADRVVELLPAAISRLSEGTGPRARPNHLPVGDECDGRSLLGRLQGETFTRALRRDQWAVLWRRPGSAEDDVPWAPLRDLAQWEELAPGRDRMYADPTPLTRDDQDWILFEELPYKTGRGVISVSRITDSGPTQPVTVLSGEHHLSYPFIVEHDGEVFMVPECAASGRVDIYRATEFPLKWAREGTLLDGVPGLDPTLLRVDGRWWMWVSLADRRGVSTDRADLYFAEDLLGPWTPHPLNPVIADVRYARPAGPIIERQGELFRPSQDCSGRYGRRLNFSRVEFDEYRYTETIIESLEPASAGVEGMHTFAETDAIGVADLVRGRFVPPWKRGGRLQLPRRAMTR